MPAGHFKNITIPQSALCVCVHCCCFVLRIYLSHRESWVGQVCVPIEFEVPTGFILNYLSSPIVFLSVYRPHDAFMHHHHMMHSCTQATSNYLFHSKCVHDAFSTRAYNNPYVNRTKYVAIHKKDPF